MLSFTSSVFLLSWSYQDFSWCTMIQVNTTLSNNAVVYCIHPCILLTDTELHCGNVPNKQQDLYWHKCHEQRTDDYDLTPCCTSRVTGDEFSTCFHFIPFRALFWWSVSPRGVFGQNVKKTLSCLQCPLQFASVS